MAFAPIVWVAIASTAVTAAAAISSANAQQKTANYNKQVGEQNANMIEQQAGAQAAQHQRRASMQEGANVANFGSSGIASDEGSALDVLSQSAAGAEADRQNLVYNGRVQATSARNGAKLAGFQADTAQTNGYMSAAGALVGGASKYYGQSPGTGSTIAVS